MVQAMGNRIAVWDVYSAFWFATTLGLACLLWRSRRTP